MRQILWVDEDTSLTEGLATLLELDGFLIHKQQTATSALEYLRTQGLDKFCAVIIDVMLTPGDDRVRFAPEITKDYVCTGLVLAKALVDEFGPSAACRIFLYTRASWPWVLYEVEKTAKELKVEWAPRNARLAPDGFVQKVMKIADKNP